MKRFWMALVLGMLVLGVVGCATTTLHEGNYTTTAYNDAENGDLIPLDNDLPPVRKIIYEVDAEYDVDDLEEAAAFLASILETDEWYDRETRQTSVYLFDVRVRTDRLDMFLQALAAEYELMTFSKVGTDISVQYQDMTNRVLALETQLARLMELYETASLSDMIVINREISEIEIDLAQLQGSLNQFDSLVEYSEVHIRFYGDTLITKSPFFNRMWTTFVGGWEAVVAFFDGLFIALAAVFPFAIVFGIPGTLIYIRVRRRKKQKLEALKQKQA